MKIISYSPPQRGVGALWLSFAALCICAGAVTLSVFFENLRTPLLAFGAAAFIFTLQFFFVGAVRRYTYAVEDGCFRVYSVKRGSRRRLFDIDLRLVVGLSVGEKQAKLSGRYGKPYKIFNFRKGFSRKTRAVLVYVISETVYELYFDTNDEFIVEIKELYKI